MIGIHDYQVYSNLEYLYNAGVYTGILKWGFPLQPNDCYIRLPWTVYALLESFNLFTKFIVLNNLQVLLFV